MAALALVALGIANVITLKNLAVIVDDTFKTDTSRLTGSPQLRERAQAWSDGASLIVPLVFFATFILGCGNLEQDQAAGGLRYFGSRVVVGVGLLAMFAVLQGRGGFVTCFGRMHGGVNGEKQKTARLVAMFHLAWMSFVSAAVTFGLIVAVWHYVPAPRHSSAFQMAFAPPLVCAAILTGVSTLMGLMGAEYPDAAREWIARIGARLALASAAWMALLFIAVYGPPAIAWLLGHYGATTLTAAVGWVGTVVAGVVAGRSAATGDADPSKNGRMLRWLIAVAPPAFLVGYLLLIAFGIHEGFAAIEHVSVAASPPIELTRQMTIDVRQPALQIDVRRPTGWLERKLQPANDWAAKFQEVYKFN